MAIIIITIIEDTGQYLLLKNSCHRTFPMIKISDPPSNSRITNSPTEGMKTSIELEIIPFKYFFHNHSFNVPLIIDQRANLRLVL